MLGIISKNTILKAIHNVLATQAKYQTQKNGYRRNVAPIPK